MPGKPASISDSTELPSIDAEEQVARLRSLLLGTEAKQVIEKLADKDQTTLVAEVVSEALQKRAQQDDSLVQSLSPLVDNALETSIQQRPERITNVIFPIIGPAIRKAVASALQEMMETLNQMLSVGLSFRSWRWRFQAWRAGMPYGEYVMLQTLQYQVEQVLLIQRSSGLLLQHVSIPSLDHEDPELVSAMLTAINDFACDAFHKDQQLCVDSIGFGDYTLTLVAGPYAILVGAIKGTPSAETNTKFAEVLEEIHLNHAALLTDFSGDRNELYPVNGLLESCLLRKTAVQPTSGKPWMAYGLVALLLLGLVVWIFFASKSYAQQQRLLNALARQGVTVVEQTKLGSSWNLVTLRSPDAPAPHSIASDIDLGNWSLFFDDRVIPEAKKPTPTVAPTQLEQARNQWQSTVTELQAARIHFQPASLDVIEDDKALLADILLKSKSLEALAEVAGVAYYRIILTGFADSRGSNSTNQRVSRDRAQTIHDYLQANGVNADKVLLWGMGALDDAELAEQDQRVVSMQVFYKLKSQQEAPL